MFKNVADKTGNRILVLVFSFVLILNSCSSDFDLNAPYKSVPIVYGLLDQSLDTQFIKINRSYLGDANNVQSASINDSTHYQSIVASVREYGVGDTINPINSYPLEEMWVSNIEDGIFASVNINASMVA